MVIYYKGVVFTSSTIVLHKKSWYRFIELRDDLPKVELLIWDKDIYYKRVRMGNINCIFTLPYDVTVVTNMLERYNREKLSANELIL